MANLFRFLFDPALRKSTPSWYSCWFRSPIVDAADVDEVQPTIANTPAGGNDISMSPLAADNAEQDNTSIVELSHSVETAAVADN